MMSRRLRERAGGGGDVPELSQSPPPMTCQVSAPLCSPDNLHQLTGMHSALLLCMSAGNGGLCNQAA